MSYSKFSTNIAKYISNEINLDDEKKQIIAYAIDSLLLSILGFLLIVFFGALFGAALPAAITSLSGGFLRRLSGGAHAETPMKCMLYSSLGYGIVSVAGYYVSKTIAINNIYLLAVLGFCLLIVARYAPVDCPAKPIHSPLRDFKGAMISAPQIGCCLKISHSREFNLLGLFNISLEISIFPIS
jgi:accessory gene regulator B